jgi:hypothetical protein
MSLPIPNLDDRSFDDLMKEATALIPTYNKEWTNYNSSDPGITLLELFSWLCEMVIYRINQVPEVNYREFLKLLGVEPGMIGSGTISGIGAIVTGKATVFDQELKVGDLISVPGQIKMITTIDSDFQLTVSSPFENDIPIGTNFTYLSAGTGKISSAGKVITGDGTAFSRELKTGGSIIVNGQSRIITIINTDISLTVDSKFNSEVLSGTKFYYSYKSIDSSIREGLESLSRRYRAITTEDYEFLAKECLETLLEGLPSRVICVNNRDLEILCKKEECLQPGYVSVIIIPKCKENTSYCNNGLPTDVLKKRIKDYLDARKLVTTRLRVVGPDYQKANLKIWISLKENTLRETVTQEAVKKEIREYFDPVTGGKDGKGWELGRPIYRSEVFQLLEGIKGVDYVMKVKINDSDENSKIENYQLILLEDQDIEVHVQ